VESPGKIEFDAQAKSRPTGGRQEPSAIEPDASVCDSSRSLELHVALRTLDHPAPAERQPDISRTKGTTT
jgi:hypothetical protein